MNAMLDTDTLVADCVAAVLDPNPETRRRAREAHAALEHMKRASIGEFWDGFAGPDCVNADLVRCEMVAPDPGVCARRMAHDVLYDQVLDAVRNNPGCRIRDIARVVAGDPNHLRDIVVWWFEQGALERRRGGPSFWRYYVVEDADDSQSD